MDKRDVFLKCGIVEPLPYLLDGGAHIRDKLENPAKITFEKFVKLSGHTCDCNDLTSLECEVHKNRKRK